MKLTIKLLVTISISFILLSVYAMENQNPQWKGTIEEEDGIKVINNPNESLYGEIEFELEEDLSIGTEDDDNYKFCRIRGLAVDSKGNILVTDMSNLRIQIFNKNGKYVRTIGREGQRLGEFEQPSQIRINAADGDIYVKDKERALDIFNNEGEYLKSLRLKNGIQDFFPLSKNTIITLFRKTSEEELTSENVLCGIDSKGEILNTFAEFPYTIFMKGTSKDGIFSTTTGFELSLYFNVFIQDKIVYGYSKEYELRVLDRDGRLLYLIKKDDPTPKFTSKELNQFKSRKLPVPQFKPYFYSIFSDTKGRIYVQRNKTEEIVRGYGPIDKTEKKVDIFNKDGYFLYKASLPPNSCIINSGFLYSHDLDEDEGMEYVKRYKIKNWEQIKDGVR